MRGAWSGASTALLLAVAAAAGGSAAEPPAEGARALVTGPGSNAMPAWLPDQRRLVFHARRPDESRGGFPVRNLWSVAPDGTDARHLTKGSKDEYHAAVSPDGTKLLFVSELNGSRDIWLADASGENAVPLTDDPGIEDQPAWAPDSRRLAWAALPQEGGSFDLWTMSADGSGRHRLTMTAANEVFPTWHRDGDTIAYVTDANGNFDLYTISTREGRTTPLLTSPDHETRPAWSPDGTKLAFARWPARGRTTHATLWVANADGTTPILLDTAPAPATHPAWAPDGRTLTFQHRGEAGWEIWTLTLPRDLARAGRLPLARQEPSGSEVDVVRLRTGETLRGAVEERVLGVRTAYGAIDLPRAAVASIRFETGDAGLARVVLVNGDSLSGFPDLEGLRVATGDGVATVAVEGIAELSLRGGSAAADGPFRALMRNGDSLLLRAAPPALRLEVAGRTIGVGAATLERIEFAEDGTKAVVTLTGGDSLSGRLATARLGLALAVGPELSVHPGSVRAIVRTAGGGS